MEIGRKIKALRQAKRVTQEEAAAHLGVSCQAVSKWETNASLPDVALLPAIAAYFGVSIDELFQLPQETEFERVEQMMDREGHIPPETFAQAARFLNGVLDEEPGNVRAHTDLAYLYNHRAQYDHYLAAEHARRALALAPEEKPGWVAYLEAMGGVCGDEWYDNHFEVIQFFKEFVETNPDNYRGYYALIENLLADGRYAEALPYIRRFQRVKDDHQALTYLGDVALGMGNRDEALRLWNAAVEKSPDAWQAYCGRADRIKKLGMIDEAEADYERCFAMQTPPRLTDGLYSLAQLHEQKGDYAAARRDYQRILDCNASDYGDYTAETDRLKAEIARLDRKLAAEAPVAP